MFSSLFFLKFTNSKREKRKIDKKNTHKILRLSRGFEYATSRSHNLSLSQILCAKNWPPSLSPSLTQPPVNPRAWDRSYVTHEMSLYAHAKFWDDRFSGLGVGSSVTDRHTKTCRNRLKWHMPVIMIGVTLLSTIWWSSGPRRRSKFIWGFCPWVRAPQSSPFII